MKISNYEIIDHGSDNEQYFQGCGVSLTEFEHVQTGSGDSAHEAFQDALERIAMAEDVDSGATDRIEYSRQGSAFSKEEAKKSVHSGMTEEECEDSDLHYYVSIRYNLIDPVTYTAPSSWSCYFINGDASGLEDDEQEAADAFLKWVNMGDPVDCEDAGFIAHPDSFSVYPYAGDCQTYTFFESEKELAK